MKTLIGSIMLTCLLMGCANKENGQLSFVPKTYKSDPCDDCPAVSIDFPEVVEKSELGDIINEAITQAVILELVYDDEMAVANPEEAMASFKTGFLDLKKMYPDESLGWEAKINGEISYEDAGILAVKIESYIFTGGAHGQSTTRFLTFDKKKKVQLAATELFKEDSGFLAYAEGKFRTQEQIPANAGINSTGFMFENNAFYLPENMGYSKEGIQLIYEQYEVASYAEGPIVLTLPYDEVQPYLTLPLTKS